MLAFECREYPNGRAQGLGCSFLNVKSPYHHSIEVDTEMFSTIYEWNDPSI
jgi:hypothetical protein